MTTTRRAFLGNGHIATIETMRNGTVIVSIRGERRFYPTEAYASTALDLCRRAVARGETP